ncbi:ATP-binding cassette domain-containing protein, partial [Bacillus altitudinis]|uniref:ATP-binding cassette domain-containing protein n=1 Tax=Bacillus altitudinis TaxID=293387 RepID=UPI0024A8E8CB
ALEVNQAKRKGRFLDVIFSVKAGDIVGVAGFMGAGRTEMMRSLFGLDPLDQGEIWVHGKKAVNKKPSDAVKLCIGFITEDRKD